MKRKILWTFFILSLLLAGTEKAFAEATIKSINPEQAIAVGNHAALADYYRSQAEAQRQVAEMHDKMKKNYQSSYVHYKGSENVMAGHCGDLKFQALKMAEQYEAMAKEEAKLAGQSNRP